MIGAETVKSDQLQGFVMATFKSPYPKLWDPHTCGKQSLHVLIAALCREKALLDAASKRFGLRRAEVAQRKLDDATDTTFL